MARGYQLVADFYGAILSGEDYVKSPPASREPVTLTGEVPKYPEGEVYDVGGIVAAYQREWLGAKPNNVTPGQLFDLVLFLDEMTEVLEARDLELRTIETPGLAGGPTVLDCEELGKAKPGYGQPCLDLQRWRARLDDYKLHLGAVPTGKESDRYQTLWTVTAPLFLGWYGGPTGSEVELAAGGFPPGFNAEQQHVADIAVPYILANQYGVAEAWDERRKELLEKDFTPSLNVPPLPTLGGWGIAMILGGSAVAGIAAGLIIRRKQREQAAMAA